MSRAVVERAEEVAGGLHVGHGQAGVDFVGGFALQREGLDGRIIVGGIADGLGEDGRVGGDAAQGFVVDTVLKLTVDKDGAADKVQPQALVELADVNERVHGVAIGSEGPKVRNGGIVFNGSTRKTGKERARSWASRRNRGRYHALQQDAFLPHYRTATAPDASQRCLSTVRIRPWISLIT